MKLITILLIASCVLFLHTALLAQDKNSSDKKGEFSLGFGFNWNKPKMKETEFISDSKLGYQIGFSYMHGNQLWWQTGLYYCHFSSSFVTVSNPEIGDLSYSEIKVPLLLGASMFPTTNNIFNIRAFAGALPGVTVGKKADANLGLMDEDFTGFHVDPTLGLDIDVLLIRARVGYAYGISNILKDYRSHPSYIYLFLGIGF